MDSTFLIKKKTRMLKHHYSDYNTDLLSISTSINHLHHSQTILKKRKKKYKMGDQTKPANKKNYRPRKQTCMSIWKFLYLYSSFTTNL